jgi:SAM-dependent methyltransferase
MDCLFCKTELTQKILDLGHSPLANGYLTEEGLHKPEINYPLDLFVCSNCFLVQLSSRTNPKEIFNENYFYISSSSETWKEHCKKYVNSIVGSLPLNNNSLVVEIGTNDGVLLEEFITRKIPVVGIDPASTATSIARSKGVPVLTEFFTNELANTLKENNKSADLIIGNNVLAHVPGMNDFVKGIETLLKPNGVCTLEFPYLLNLFSDNEFDTIYHEHYSYFSLTAFNKIITAHELKIFNLEKINIHGGSLRVYLQKVNGGEKSIEPIVTSTLEKELSLGISTPEFYTGLQDKAVATKKQFLSWLMQCIDSGKKVIAYGAAAKGNTFLNYSRIDKDLLPFIADVTKQKQGLYLPGSHIPVVEESLISEYKPDFIVVLPWNFKAEINQRLEYVKSWGGKLVYFIPYFEIV